VPEPEQIRPFGPGPLATRTDAYIYELSQEGLNDEFSATDGGWLGLLKADPSTPLYDPAVAIKTELNEAEQRFLLSKVGVIIEQKGGGGVTVDYFTQPEELDAAWAALQETRADVAEERDMDAEPEIPEPPPTLEVTSAMLIEAEAEGRQDAQQGSGRGSTPSLARLDGWAAAYGYHPETHGNELGALTDAWRQGVYREVAGQ